MRDKKKAGSGKTPEQQALERHVDAMMDPKLPDDDAAAATLREMARKTSALAATAAKPKAVAVEDAPEQPLQTTPAGGVRAATAPELPAKLRKQITVSHGDDQADGTQQPAVRTAKTAPETPAKPDAEEPEAEETASDEIDTETTDDAADTVDATAGSTDLDDARTDEAVDDIVAYEGDVVLAVADSTAAEKNRHATSKTSGKKHPVLSGFFWTLIFLTVVIIILLVGLFVTGGNVSGLHVPAIIKDLPHKL